MGWPFVILTVAITAVVVAAVTWFLATNAAQKKFDRTVGGADVKAREIIDEALKTGEARSVKLFLRRRKKTSS